MDDITSKLAARIKVSDWYDEPEDVKSFEYNTGILLTKREARQILAELSRK